MSRCSICAEYAQDSLDHALLHISYSRATGRWSVHCPVCNIELYGIMDYDILAEALGWDYDSSLKAIVAAELKNHVKETHSGRQGNK